METILIRAKNNLDIPIRLTLTNSGYQGDSQIFITIGREGIVLKDYYDVCVDTDLLPIKEWKEIGSLYINTKSDISFKGEPNKEVRK